MLNKVLKVKPPSFPIWALLCLIVLLGLYFRVAVVLETVVDVPVRSDARLYYLYSLNILENGTFSRSLPDEAVPIPDAFAPPIYPLAITPLLEFPPTDRMLMNIGLMQAMLGSLTILLAYLLIKEIGGHMAGLLAAALTAISPHLISLTVYMLTETLFTFLMMAGLLCIVYALKTNRILYSVSAGVLIGLAALTRSTLEYFPIFALVCFLAYMGFKRFDRGQMRIILAFFGIAIGVVAIWKIRNFAVLGILSDPTLMISTLQHGMYPDFMFNGIRESQGIPYRFDPRTAEISSSLHSVLHEIFTRFQTAPGQHLLWYLFGKPTSLLSWSMIDGWGDIFVYPILASPFFTSPLFQTTRSLMLGLHPFLMVGGIAGSILFLIRAFRSDCFEQTDMVGLVLPILVMYFVLLHMVGAPFPRYGVPLRPVMYGLAALLTIEVSRWAAKTVRNRIQSPENNERPQ